MNSQKQEFNLPELRRQLEELLLMVKADLNRPAFHKRTFDVVDITPPTHSDNHQERCTAQPESHEVALPDAAEPDERDSLYDDALVVVTEFGQASPAILQMWLSIDYSRASTIISRFQADGLISAKGRIRHKAFELRRSIEHQA